MSLEKINFRQSRDFGETFNVSIKFIRQNFKLFFQSILYIAGPFILFSAIAGAFYQSNAISLFSVTKLGQANPFSRIFEQFGWAYVIFIITAVISGLVVINTVYSFMLNYFEKGPDGFTLNDVSNTVVKNIGNVLSVFFIFTLTILIILVVVIGIMTLIMSTVPVLGMILLILLFFSLLILLPPFMWQLSAIYIVKMYEHKSVLDCFTRTRDIMRGNFWWTWVLIFSAGVAVMLAGVVFSMPQAIYQMVLMFTHIKNGTEDVSVSFIIVATVCHFFTSLVYSTIHIINGFHYFSLAEKNDGQGLLERINEIGATQDNNVEQQY